MQTQPGYFYHFLAWGYDLSLTFGGGKGTVVHSVNTHSPRESESESELYPWSASNRADSPRPQETDRHSGSLGRSTPETNPFPKETNTKGLPRTYEEWLKTSEGQDPNKKYKPVRSPGIGNPNKEGQIYGYDLKNPEEFLEKTKMSERHIDDQITPKQLKSLIHGQQKTAGKGKKA